MTLPNSMKAVITTGNGGFDKLNYTDTAVPKPGAGEVLLQVLAAGINNTEINTRLGWYSSSVETSTEEAAATSDNTSKPASVQDGGWNKSTPFPFIQGTDCCGRVVETGEGVSNEIQGQRVLVRACMRTHGFDSLENFWMASDFDGAFAQFVKVPASEVFPIDCDWSDAELATIPCAYGTAENMLHRAGVDEHDTVLITGASGGVGSAAVQLALRRGARVIAVAGKAKLDQVNELCPTQVVDRNENLVEIIGEEMMDVVVDNVAGNGFGQMLKILKRGGRFVSSGAIGGPLVTLDMRDFYLKDLNLIGCTAWDEPVFPNLVSYIENGEIKPLLAATFPLDQIVAAQKAFLKKEHVGNFVLVPPPLSG